MSWIVTAAVIGCVALAVTAGALWLLHGSIRRTRRNRYFGLPSAERRALTAQTHARGRIAAPLIRVATAVWHPRKPASFVYRGVAGPAVVCRPKDFALAASYEPDPRDIFVAAQMRCGTTWMQQVVYELLSHGKGDLSDLGHGHLYAMSPWIEANQSVGLADAPRIGDRGDRIVKTHLPTRLCPYSSRARYVYVTRHPVACFSSCVDFVRMGYGLLTPSLPDLLAWYCSDAMWWRSWPEHTEGWWRWAAERPNVLFVHFEEMLNDLAGVVRRVGEFLDCPPSEAVLAEVVRKSGFAYMKEHEDVFEMTVPSPLSRTRGFLVDGSRDRERGPGEAERARVLEFCRRELRGASYPAARFYPDVGIARTSSAVARTPSVARPYEIGLE